MSEEERNLTSRNLAGVRSYFEIIVMYATSESLLVLLTEVDALAAMQYVRDAPRHGRIDAIQVERNADADISFPFQMAHFATPRNLVRRFRLQHSSANEKWNYLVQKFKKYLKKLAWIDICGPVNAPTFGYSLMDIVERHRRRASC